MFEVFFDVETKKFFNDIEGNDPANLGVSIVSMYFREIDGNLKEISGEIKSFWEKDFENMWRYFREADRIIGFNSKNFDVPALKPYAPPDFSRLTHFDILEKVREKAERRVSLNSLAKDTLNNKKTDSGANAILYWEKGDEESLTKLRTYCEADVMLTRDLYDFALTNKILKFTDYWNNPRTIEVDFSYPEDYSSNSQGSLF